MKTFAPMQKQWQLGVRPAFPAQTVNSGAVLQPGESWQAPAAPKRGLLAGHVCRGSWCSAVSRR
ncbi:alpha-2-macroglobulin domain-containing protein [Klebsiella michiganensis]|uniref:Alpha-2-macroglobulin domain-containing protein n=1 Tax=Klebsiella michiganensis TaxID=1134687 RepID=A0A7H4PND7_9ENTR|nr:alpha-2-macroglobulin domain-containing protein [Klebsiella michiganensis]